MNYDDEDSIEVRGTLAYLDALQALEAGNLREAQRYLEKALGFGLDEADDAREHLADVYFRTEQREKGVEVTEELLRTAPSKFSDPDIRYELFPHVDLFWAGKAANLMERLGPLNALEFMETKQPLTEAVPGTHFPYFYMQLGSVYFELRRYSDAADAWKRCIQAEIPYPSDHPLQARVEEAKQMAKNNLANFREHGIGGGCWIASAACGPSSPVTNELRRFRDEMLCELPGGLQFISFYNHTSPAIAEVMNKSSVIRTVMRLGIVAPAFWLARLALYFRHSRNSI